MMFVTIATSMELSCYASNTDEITLTVSSDGTTKDEAIKNSLRTAIEQAYGAFVSANTTILNDELVKDEIVTVSNGSIKDYKEISSTQMANGSYSVTLSATVSLPNLITYAKSHGSECEFAGNTFGMEVRLFNLQKENELKAISNLIPMVKSLCRTSMKWEMKIDEPILLKGDGKFLYDSYHSLSIKSDEVKDLISSIPSSSNLVFDEQQEFCVVHFELFWKRTGIKNRVAQYLYEALSKIGLDRETYLEKMDKGFDVSGFTRWGLWNCSDDDPSIYNDEFNGYYYFRNNEETMNKAFMEINNAIQEEKLKFNILDNNGSSDFNALDFISLINNGLDSVEIKRSYGDIIFSIPKTDLYFFKPDGYDVFYWGINGTGLFKNLFAIYPNDSYLGAHYVFEDRKWEYCFDKADYPSSFSIYVILPVSEIGKYSSFRIERK